MTRPAVHPRLGRSLQRLRPLQHALRDPHYRLQARPIDAAWNHAAFTGAMAGFNPLYHTHYYAAESELARWLADPTRPCDDLAAQERLVRDALRLAHDYLHSWAYRAIAAIDPSLRIYDPITADNLEDQVFLLVLTETVAVVGLDYWYLCLRDAGERLGIDAHVGPCTVHYRERHLAEYRRFHPTLTVQHPAFFGQLLRLYARGEFVGFTEDDLLASPELAHWLIRELLIAPRQRIVSRQWLGRLGGLDLAEHALDRPLAPPSPAQQRLASAIGELLWRKVKRGAALFYPGPAVPVGWRYPPRAARDYRFLTADPRDRPAPTDAPDGAESFSFFVDQRLSHHHLPRADHDALRREIAEIKAHGDPARLERLVATLAPVDPGGADPVPLELLFVN